MEPVKFLKVAIFDVRLVVCACVDGEIVGPNLITVGVTARGAGSRQVHLDGSVRSGIGQGIYLGICCSLIICCSPCKPTVQLIRPSAAFQCVVADTAFQFVITVETPEHAATSMGRSDHHQRQNQ